jgi:hypothetical protein
MKHEAKTLKKNVANEQQLGKTRREWIRNKSTRLIKITKTTEKKIERKVWIYKCFIQKKNK